jgi:hypothetical protein
MKPDASKHLTQALLCAGITAGPLYLLAGLIQALTREGFDMRRHAISLLSNGDLGWIQIANFLVSGLFVILGALGVRRVLNAEMGGTWGPLLLAIFGLGLIGAGIFVADPGSGFPPGTPMKSTGLSRDGMLHFVFGGLGFYGLIAACFVFARRFLKSRRVGWAAYSVLAGVLFFAAFAAIASGSKGTAIMLGFYAAVAWIWIWHTALLTQVLHEFRNNQLELS